MDLSKNITKHARILPLLGAFYLMLLLGFSAGILTMYFETWPHSVLVRVHRFIKGDQDEHSSLLSKVSSQFGNGMARISVPWESGIEKSLLRDVFHPAFRKELDPPLIYSSKKVSHYPKALMTSFLFSDAPLSIILIDQSGEIRHRWNIKENYYEPEDADAPPPLIGDFVVLDDGSVITFVSKQRGLFRIGLCGELLWRIDGYFHHHMSLTEDGRLWVLGYAGAFQDEETSSAYKKGGRGHIEIINELDIQNGKVLKTIRLVDVMEKNLDRMDPFFSVSSRRHVSPSGLLTTDLWHPNDVEVLPKSLENQFADFSAGDLAVSMRNINLIVVIDPESLEIKWWSQGAVQRQHDPDWRQDGTLSIFNNRNANNRAGAARHNFSAIQIFDFRDDLPKKWIEGSDYNFMTELAGFHDKSPDGHVLISSTTQGRVFELDPNQDIVMEFIHRYNGDDALWAGSARYVDPEVLERTKECN